MYICIYICIYIYVFKYPSIYIIKRKNIFAHVFWHPWASLDLFCTEEIVFGVKNTLAAATLITLHAFN